jgi:hypothetical protein
LHGRLASSQRHKQYWHPFHLHLSFERSICNRLQFLARRLAQSSEQSKVVIVSLGLDFEC